MAKVTAFEVFYKRLGPTGSNYAGSYLYPGGTSARVTAGFLPRFWYTASVTTGNVRVSSSYVNFPKDPSATVSYASTRNEASMSGFIALPWSSPVCDFLWNCNNISWSFIDSSSTYVTNSLTRTKTTTKWLMTQNNPIGFFKSALNSPYGVSRYNVTSSWHIIDPQTINQPGIIPTMPGPYPSGNYFQYVSYDSNIAGTYGNTFPVAIGANPDPDAPYYAGGFDEYLPNWGLGYTVKWPNAGFNYNDGLQAYLAKSSLEYFDKGVCVGINRGQVEQSQIDITAAYLKSLYPGLYGGPGAYDPTNPADVSNPAYIQWFADQFKAISTALKQRRLFYPTLVSGSGTPGGTDYWHKEYTGYRAIDIFQDNGGIYNVQFTLKRYGLYGSPPDDPIFYDPLDYQPDPGSCMKVFIANVQQNLSGSLRLKVGDADSSVYPHTILEDRVAPGLYPPDNNIVICGHGYQNGPVMSFYDVLTGARVEKFSINLIQYGYPAQLCFEPCVVYNGNNFPLDPSEAANGNIFSCMIDDISVCKIGMTTDVRYVQPLTITQQTQNAATGSIIRTGGTTGLQFYGLEA